MLVPVLLGFAGGMALSEGYAWYRRRVERDAYLRGYTQASKEAHIEKAAESRYSETYPKQLRYVCRAEGAPEELRSAIDAGEAFEEPCPVEPLPEKYPGFVTPEFEKRLKENGRATVMRRSVEKEATTC